MKSKTIDKFIEESINLHGNKYDYSKVIYINSKSKIDIICNTHGIFSQTPSNHLRERGCPKCWNEQRPGFGKKTLSQFLLETKSKHRDRYDYSKVIYVNGKTKVSIICVEHGEFMQTPAHHLRGEKCPKCSKKYIINDNIIEGYNRSAEKKRKKDDVFLKDALDIHGNKYDYSLVKYKNSTSKIKIICPFHGEFMQLPMVHLQRSGCPLCKSSHGEVIINNYLELNKIKYFRQYKFDGCKNKRKLSFDFYLPENNLCIEYDGIQHYESRKLFGGENAFLKCKENDLIKNNFCEINKIQLLRIKYTDNIIKKLDILLSSFLNNFLSNLPV